MLRVLDDTDEVSYSIIVIIINTFIQLHIQYNNIIASNVIAAMATSYSVVQHYTML